MCFLKWGTLIYISYCYNLIFISVYIYIYYVCIIYIYNNPPKLPMVAAITPTVLFGALPFQETLVQGLTMVNMVSPAKGSSNGLIHKNDDVWMGMGGKSYDIDMLWCSHTLHAISILPKSRAWLSSIHLGAAASSRRRCGSESRPANIRAKHQDVRNRRQVEGDGHANNIQQYSTTDITAAPSCKLQRFFLHAKHSQPLG